MNSKLLLFLLTLLTVSYFFYQNTSKFLQTSNLEDDQFALWQQKHNKVYISNQELQTRKQVFLQNLKKMETLRSSGVSYQVGLNQFSDLTFEEFAGMNPFL